MVGLCHNERRLKSTRFRLQNLYTRVWSKGSLAMVKVLWKVYCADNRPNIEKYEMNGNMLQVSTKNKMLPSTVFHPLTSIVLVDDLIVVQRCHNTENVQVFVNNAWETCQTDCVDTLTTASVFYITCPSAPNCVRNGIAQPSQDQGPDIEMFFYLEDTEQEPLQTRMRVLQGLIKSAHWIDSLLVLSDWWGLQHPRLNDDDCFYDFQSSLVPLIEGLCSSDSSFRVYVHIFCSSFSEENMFQKKSSSRFHPASQHFHTHVYFVHVYEHRYAEI